MGPPRSHHRTHAAPAHQTSPPPRLPCHQRLAGTPHTAPAVGITRRHLHVGGNPPRRRGAHLPVAPGRGDTHTAPRHTPPPHPRGRGRRRKRPHSGGRGLRDGERRHRSMATRSRAHQTPHRSTGVTPLARGHRATAHRHRHRKRPTGMGGQMGTRVRLPARRAAQTLPH